MNDRGQSIADTPAAPSWWVSDGRGEQETAAGYGEMMDAMRTLQERITTAVPDATLVAEVTRHLEDLNRRLEPSAAGHEWGRSGELVGNVLGREQTLIPPVEIVAEGETWLDARIRFGDYYRGSNGAVHGGTIPLVFDDVLGRLSLSGNRPVARTAYMHVDFRSITPVGRLLTLEARFEREEGRKRCVRGWLRDGERLCAEAEALFVQLRPGQP
ncbi:PaaI family thioesterase [Nocardia sp. CA-135953]|uniref:PaaI family thioesterase n=1 Tax=Nocardia sp. CA-135953 TaxID=3239978 RepID=UPI003D96CD1F